MTLRSNQKMEKPFPPCSSLNYNNLIQDAKYQNLKGSVFKSVNCYQKNVTYVPRGSLACHVGINNCLHNWCKEKEEYDSTLWNLARPQLLNADREEPLLSDRRKFLQWQVLYLKVPHERVIFATTWRQMPCLYTRQILCLYTNYVT